MTKPHTVHQQIAAAWMAAFSALLLGAALFILLELALS